MALQDLTPQLRTRLSRMERAVGWFVILATALLVFGFSYYVYTTAKRKGWFVTKARYFTYSDRATGLKVGDPVNLMGFDVGQITRIDTMAPWETYNVYVEFEIKEPYNGYLWSGHNGSRAKITSADFLGKRVLEVTKGYGGYPAYRFHPLREVTRAEADASPHADKWQLAEESYDATGTNLVLKALAPLHRTNLVQLAALGLEKFRILDTREEKKSPTAVWDDRKGCYQPFSGDNLYWFVPDEAPAVTERLEKLAGQIEKALPNFLGLTNQLTSLLANGVAAASNLNALTAEARPVVTNLGSLSAQLRGPGAFGDWMLGSNGIRQLNSTFENANLTVAHADTNLTALAENLARSLDHLAGITSNLNAQVQANTNILSEISTAIVDADGLMQGLKRHWLLRSAFKEKKTDVPPPTPRLTSPKDQGNP